ncbi:MAG: hypothetical protein IJ133_05510 [Clostridia bacterium]|nr:hypothetical protein [Clostridia bacterium]
MTKPRRAFCLVLALLLLLTLTGGSLSLAAQPWEVTGTKSPEHGFNLGKPTRADLPGARKDTGETQATRKSGSIRPRSGSQSNQVARRSNRTVRNGGNRTPVTVKRAVTPVTTASAASEETVAEAATTTEEGTGVVINTATESKTETPATEPANPTMRKVGDIAMATIAVVSLVSAVAFVILRTRGNDI